MKVKFSWFTLAFFSLLLCSCDGSDNEDECQSFVSSSLVENVKTYRNFYPDFERYWNTEIALYTEGENNSFWREPKLAFEVLYAGVNSWAYNREFTEYSASTDFIDEYSALGLTLYLKKTHYKRSRQEIVENEFDQQGYMTLTTYKNIGARTNIESFIQWYSHDEKRRVISGEYSYTRYVQNTNNQNIEESCTGIEVALSYDDKSNIITRTFKGDNSYLDEACVERVEQYEYDNFKQLFLYKKWLLTTETNSLANYIVKIVVGKQDLEFVCSS